MFKKILIANGMAALALHPVPAAACSISFTHPRNPAVRYAGTDVRRVTGTYRIEPSQEIPGMIRARVTTRRSTWFDVEQPYHPLLVECAAYDLPLNDAEGLFYLSQRSRNGRYRVLGWSGRYVPGLAIRPDHGEESPQ